jgi:hypothetical protein
MLIRHCCWAGVLCLLLASCSREAVLATSGANASSPSQPHASSASVPTILSFWHRGASTGSVLYFELRKVGDDAAVVGYTLAVNAPYLNIDGSVTGTIRSSASGRIGFGSGPGKIFAAPMAGLVWGQVQLRDQLDITGMELLQ